ncbi:6-phospho-3-hexuloisomerase [Paenactinomyces guangxiensis]|uniref:6-phospho-3-hexuloisomerase n=1 Tax=Paenactinomyces guangxiensis TaxID=1490290 RepID=A0A7W2A7V2_9BACL|nr:6-phospho-3-hexuloisomerase [Paenactinomyces guangxiensis]MBA4493188.1 6-phospho-3-hexuloisomerase [Paenactinomyces guangxiensis]MBH8589962.1 6-phospho-3-hexuloisomerase [Paenactinomyces guangxiensis]
MSDITTIMNEIDTVLSKLKKEAIAEFTSVLQSGKRIFVSGEGRSGLMAKSFAMRLMHLGANVFVVGETITPALEKGDVLVSVSGSGTTQSVLLVARKARELGCPVVAVTTNPESELAGLATYTLHVPAATKYRRTGEQASVQPLGSLFDQCTHILFDAVCLHYASLNTVDHDSAFKKHSNLE